MLIQRDYIYMNIIIHLGIYNLQFTIYDLQISLFNVKIISLYT